MTASILNFLLSGLGKSLSLLTSVDPAIRAPIAISLGAIPGALSRYYVTLFFAQWLGTSFPYGTFVINITGALVMGFFVTLTLERTITSPDLRLMVAVGVFGILHDIFYLRFGYICAPTFRKLWVNAALLVR